MLSSSLRNVEVSTIHAPDDSDLLIVTTAVYTAFSANMPVAVIGEDTDWLILLLHLVNTDGPNVFMISDKNCSNEKLWSINEMKEQLREQFRENL